MKFAAFFVLALVSVESAFAIEFITEEDVQQKLNAEKVIEISTATVQDKLLEEGSPCYNRTLSRSGRAYVVSTRNGPALYVTSSGLSDLTNCGEL